MQEKAGEKGSRNKTIFLASCK